jgi:ankyrin repeat protein
MTLFSSKTREQIDLALKRGENINTKNYFGQSFLHILVLRNDETLIDHVLSKNIDVNIEDNVGRTPIFYAKNQEVAKKLLMHSAIFINRDKIGKSAINSNIFVKNFFGNIVNYKHNR